MLSKIDKDSKIKGSINDIKLPIDERKEEIMTRLKNDPVVLINGETGCGKSTRIPIFLKDLHDRNVKEDENFCALVTCPRRPACTNLAATVSKAFGEPIGETVGYMISRDTKFNNKTKIIFATTGFVLAMALSQPDKLLQYSHIVLDEVHERSID